MLTGAIFSIRDQESFERTALDVFRYQAQHIRVYKEWLQQLKCDPLLVSKVEAIPFLPIRLFRSHEVMAEGTTASIVFSSSGTTGAITSRHFVADVSVYEESFLTSFRQYYGEPSDYCFIALLPSYLEREGSSLVYMADRLIRESNHADSGFYLNQYAELHELLTVLRDRKQQTILLGVTYALLDLAEQFPMDFPNLIIMETGGMKGKRKELVREDLHAQLMAAFGVPAIHSEYGMTELLSQGYSSGKGIYTAPPWMQILIRDINDPFRSMPDGATGGVNVIDLANIHSCSFLATDDLGKRYTDGSFEVLGRFDHSDLRGCNLMIS